MVWYSHLFKNFPQFAVIHTIKKFGIVNEAAVDIFLKFPGFLHDPVNVGNLISGSLPFLNPAVPLEVLGSHTAEPEGFCALAC